MLVQIVVPNPGRNVHAHAFDEVLETLLGGLHKLGVTAELTFDYLGSTTPTIVIAPHLHDQAVLMSMPTDTIMYSFEPLVGHGLSLVPEQLRLLLSRFIIWDYSARNVTQWRAEGAQRVVHVPVGYDDILEHLGEPGLEQWDVLFYGSLSARRAAVLLELQARGLRVQALFGVYGSERDAVIRRSRLVINLHQNNRGEIETPRLSYLWANRVPVVVELNPDTEDSLDVARHGLVGPYAGFADRVEELVQDSAARRHGTERVYAEFSTRLESEYLAQAIEASARLSTVTL